MVSVAKSDVMQWLIEELQARRIVGLHRYGEPLNPENKRDNLRDALEEALDLAAYLRNEIVKRDALEAENKRLRAALNDPMVAWAIQQHQAGRHLVALVPPDQAPEGPRYAGYYCVDAPAPL